MDEDASKFEALKEFGEKILLDLAKGFLLVKIYDDVGTIYIMVKGLC